MKTKKRIAPHVIEDDHAVMVALRSLPGYAPRNPVHSIASMEETASVLAQLLHEERLNSERAIELRAQIAQVSNQYHDQVLGGKAEAVVQFGNNSLEIKALGLKRKSERRQPRRSAEIAA